MLKKIGLFVLLISTLTLASCDDDEAANPDAGKLKFDHSNWDQSNWG
jgi:hypothetical protein